MHYFGYSTVMYFTIITKFYAESFYILSIKNIVSIKIYAKPSEELIIN